MHQRFRFKIAVTYQRLMNIQFNSNEEEIQGLTLHPARWTGRYSMYSFCFVKSTERPAQVARHMSILITTTQALQQG